MKQNKIKELKCEIKRRIRTNNVEIRNGVSNDLRVAIECETDFLKKLLKLMEGEKIET